MEDIFAAKLVQAKLGTKNATANSIEKADFDDKLKSINLKVIPKKTRHIEVNKKQHHFAKKLS